MTPSRLQFTVSPQTALRITLEAEEGGSTPAPAPGAPGGDSELPGPIDTAPPPPAPPADEQPESTLPLTVEAVEVYDTLSGRSNALALRVGDPLITFACRLIFSDGSRRDALPIEVTWRTQSGRLMPVNSGGVFEAGAEGTEIVYGDTPWGTDDIDVTVLPAVVTAPPLPAPAPPPSAPPPPLPSGAKRVLYLDFSDAAQFPGVADVPGLFHEAALKNPSIGTPAALGNIEFVDGGNIPGRVLREYINPTTPWAVKGRWALGGDYDQLWLRWLIRFPADFLSAWAKGQPANHKQAFMYFKSGTQRLERTGLGFGISSGVGGDDVASARTPDGGMNFGGPAGFPPHGVFDGFWTLCTMAGVRLGDTWWAGWWIEHDGVELFKGGGVKNFAGDPKFHMVGLPENLNGPPIARTYYDIAMIEAVAGADPWGKLKDLTG